MTEDNFRILFFVLTALGLMMAVVLVFLRASYASTVSGMGVWALGQLMVSVAAALIGGGGLLPDFWPAFAGSVLMLTGISFLHFGLQLFFGLRPSYRVWLGVVALTLFVLIWFYAVDPNFRLRRLVFLAVLAGMLLSMTRLIWLRATKSFASSFLKFSLLLGAICIGVRMQTIMALASQAELSRVSNSQAIVLGLISMMFVIWSLGFLLMASQRLHDRLEHVASHDSLTHTLTRRAMLTACERELERCRRHGRSMALLVLDIDFFKRVNDRHGHQTGDRVLVEFVQRIMLLLRRPDQLGRYGGEEFVVLLPETSVDEARVVADRIRAAIDSPFQGLQSITVSIGLTVNAPDDARFDNMLARADNALYQAKQQGRNRVVVA